MRSDGAVRHTLLAGTEFGRQLTDNFRNTGFFNNTFTTFSVPLANPKINTPVTFRQNGTDADNHVQANVVATMHRIKSSYLEKYRCLRAAV